MAKRKHIPVRGEKISEAKKKNAHHPHFDYMNNVLANEHFGLYIIVKSTSQYDPKEYNRLYLKQDVYLQFLTEANLKKLKGGALNQANYFLLDSHPEHTKLIKKVACSIPESKSRSMAKSMLSGFSIIIDFFQKQDISIPDDPLDFTVSHHEILKNAVEKDVFSKKEIRLIKIAWLFLKEEIKNKNIVNLPQEALAKKQLEDMVMQEDEVALEDMLNIHDNENDISSEVLFQLDFFAQEELNRLVSRRKEYLEWMRELDELNKNGGLFSQANLLKTYYSNHVWDNVRRHYINKFSEDPVAWTPYAGKVKTVNGIKHNLKVYPNKQAEKRHKELLAIAENGIDISIRSEKILAWWIATIMPNFPFDRKVLDEYKIYYKDGQQFYDYGLKRLNIVSEKFMTRYIVTKKVIYPLYLLMLIRYEINMEPLTNAEIYLKDGKYELGGNLYNARYIGKSTIKTRSNAIIPIVVQKGSDEDKFIDFFLEWMKPMFEKSILNIFFQYYDLKLKTFKPLNSKAINLMHQSKYKQESQFFQRYKIYETIEVTGTSQSETKQEKKRIEWIRHSNIRAAGNYARYVQRFNQYARSKLELKHKNDSTEMISYHNKEFKWMMGHQLGLTQAVLVNHVMGINRNEQLANLFQTPMASCSDPKAPTYNNAPKIKEDEICTAWWQCLVSCDRANVNPIINGPYIMAFKRVMKDLKKEYSRDQDWEKEFIVPYRSVKARLKQFTKEEIKHCETSYPKCLDFIRNLMHFRYPKMRSKETNNV